MQALIDPSTPVQHIIGWSGGTPPYPVYETYPNSARVCEVSANTFPVAEPLFWTACDDTIVADEYWYSTQTGAFSPVDNDPPPPVVSDSTTGVQTL
jgi:hypothetical protein